MEKNSPTNQIERENTLLVKQGAKLNHLGNFKSRLAVFVNPYWASLGEMTGLIVLILLNFLVLLPFFGAGDESNVFSAPLVPFLADLLVFAVPPDYAVRIWLLAFLIFAPLAWYFFVKEISGRKIIGLITALIMSLSFNGFLPARIQLGLLGQDGGQIASLSIIPIVGLAFLKFIRNGHFSAAVFSALGMALVALSSPFGLFILMIYGIIIAFSEMLLGLGRLKMARLLVIIVMAFGFSAFWYHPKFLLLTILSPGGQQVWAAFSKLIPISFFLVPLLAIFGFLFFENRAHLQGLFIAVFLTIIFALLYLGTGISNSSPSRFLPALGISSAYLIASLSGLVFDFLRSAQKIGHWNMEVRLRQWLAFGFIIVFVCSLGLTVLVSGLRLGETFLDSSVLGVMTENRTGIWEIKEKTTLGETIIGYGITLFTVLTTTLLKLKLR